MLVFSIFEVWKKVFANGPKTTPGHPPIILEVGQRFSIFSNYSLTLRVVSVDLYFPQPCMKDSCSYSIVQIKCPKGQLDIKQQCVK